MCIQSNLTLGDRTKCVGLDKKIGRAIFLPVKEQFFHNLIANVLCCLFHNILLSPVLFSKVLFQNTKSSPFLQQHHQGNTLHDFSNFFLPNFVCLFHSQHTTRFFKFFLT